jgi:hypothetical protein
MNGFEIDGLYMLTSLFQDHIANRGRDEESLLELVMPNGTMMVVTLLPI